MKIRARLIRWARATAVVGALRTAAVILELEAIPALAVGLDAATHPESDIEKLENALHMLGRKRWPAHTPRRQGKSSGI